MSLMNQNFNYSKTQSHVIKRKKEISKMLQLTNLIYLFLALVFKQKFPDKILL